MGSYNPLVELIGHKDLGGKTLLYLVDGLYSGVHPDDLFPRRWAFPPFNGDWTSSLLASQDPVAIDSVGFDFVRAEWEDYPRNVGVDDYLLIHTVESLFKLALKAPEDIVGIDQRNTFDKISQDID